MNSKTEPSRRDPEDIQIAALGANILAQIGKESPYLPSLSEYLDTAQQIAKVGILFPLIEEILKSGFTPDDLLLAISQYSYRWGCNEVTTNIENASTALAIFLREKARSEESMK